MAARPKSLVIDRAGKTAENGQAWREEADGVDVAAAGRVGKTAGAAVELVRAVDDQIARGIELPERRVDAEEQITVGGGDHERADGRDARRVGAEVGELLALPH